MKKITAVILSVIFLASLILPISSIKADEISPDYSGNEIINISDDQNNSLEIEVIGKDGYDELFEEWEGYPFGAATTDLDSAKEDLANIFAMIFIILLPVLVLTILSVYIYTSLAYMAIAKKTGTRPAWLAWIPIANLYLISKMARMHWWPILLIPVMIVPILGIFAIVALSVYVFIWHWKIFERMNRPGWWALTLLISGLGMVVFYVFLGMTAWSRNDQKTSSTATIDSSLNQN